MIRLFLVVAFACICPDAPPKTWECAFEKNGPRTCLIRDTTLGLDDYAVCDCSDGVSHYGYCAASVEYGVGLKLACSHGTKAVASVMECSTEDACHFKLPPGWTP